MKKTVRVICVINKKIVSIKNVNKGYVLIENERFCLNGKINQMEKTKGEFIDDPKDEIEREKNNRLFEVRVLISDKKLLDETCTKEQKELRSLLNS